MNLRLSLTAFAVLALLPFAAQAQGSRRADPYSAPISYTWMEGRFLLLDPDGGDDADGIRLGGSGRIQDNLFVIGGLSMIDFDSGVDAERFDLGLGLRHPLETNIDLVGVGGLVYTDIDNRGRGGDDDTGILLSGGVRANLGPQFELDGFVTYADEFGDGDITLSGDALFHATSNLSLLAGLALSDDVDTISLGVRWSFVPHF